MQLESAPSVACFLYGTHDNGHFIELLGQYQYDTENKEKHNKFLILHACIFRCAFGHNTSREMIDPTTGIWTSTGDEEPSMLNAVAPASDEVLASTFDHPDVCILPSSRFHRVLSHVLHLSRQPAQTDLT